MLLDFEEVLELACLLFLFFFFFFIFKMERFFQRGIRIMKHVLGIARRIFHLII